MLLRKLLDPEETARRRKLRARIVRRNRIQREIAQGLEPKWRRAPKAPARTVHDYGWDPLQDGTAVAADAKRIENEGNALAFLVKAASATEPVGLQPAASTSNQRLRSPAVMEGVQQVAPRFANRTTAAESGGVVNHSAAAGDGTMRLVGGLPGGAGRTAAAAAPSRPQNERVRRRWRDVLQLIMIQRHEAILTKDANRKWRQERLGLLLFDRKQFKQASEHLVKAITLGSDKGICWRRLAQCHWYGYDESHDWDGLWDAKAAFEQALSHLEMACNPYVLYDYARVLEALGSYDSALNACASLLTTFPRFACGAQVKLRFVLLQLYQFLAYGSNIESGDKERALAKCIGITKGLLLDEATTKTEQQYALVLYVHVRLNELLYETTAKRGDGPGSVARAARTSADTATEELFTNALGLKLATMAPGLTWKLWRVQSETFLRWADHFQSQGENIAAADALSRALKLMDTPPSPAATVPAAAKPADRTNDGVADRKIALYLAMATNYYESNQMERAIRCMETIFQLNPYLETVRASLAAWFPAKWKDRLELEDASHVQIARVLRGLWGRRRAAARRREVKRQLEARYRASPYHPLHRRNVLRLLKPKYASLFAAQDVAARRIQRTGRIYLGYARIRWTLQEMQDKEISSLRAKYGTRKYRYNRHVRFHLARLVPDEFGPKFRAEETAAGLLQRWVRGERVRRVYRAKRATKQAQQERAANAAATIQRSYRHYHERCNVLAHVRAEQLLFEAQRRLQLAREHLAVQLQRLYRQRKNRLVVATRIDVKRRQQQRQATIRSRSAARIQRGWRRFVARRRGDTTGSEASILLDQLRRGHDRLLAEDEDAKRQPPRDMDGSARKIQVMYRGRRFRASLANITRRAVEPSPSEIDLLLATCERRHATGDASRVVLASLNHVREKRALFDFPVVVLRPAERCVELPLQHLTAAVQHSSVLHTLVIQCGDLCSPHAERLFRSLQQSKTIQVLALGGVVTRRKRCRPGGDVPEHGDAEDGSDDDEEKDSDDDDDGDGEDGRDDVETPMRVLYEVLRTKHFLLEQLALDGNDLLRRNRDGRLLASVVGDFFYGRYGRLTTLSAQRMDLSDANAALLGDALAINTALRHLNLSGNAIRDDAAAAIASRGLCANNTLEYLNLADNSIGSGGAKALFASLATSNRSLRTLILSNNVVMNDAVASLFAAWQANAVVEHVDLRGNLIHADHLVELDQAMRERTATTNEELRLFLARRRLGCLNGADTNAASGALSLSPLKRTRSTKKRHAPALSPQKWIKAQASAASAATTRAASLIQPPCVVFKQQPASSVGQFATYPSPTNKKTSSVRDPSPSKKRQKPIHTLPGASDKLPILWSGDEARVSAQHLSGR